MSAVQMAFSASDAASGHGSYAVHTSAVDGVQMCRISSDTWSLTLAHCPSQPNYIENSMRAIMHADAVLHVSDAVSGQLYSDLDLNYLQSHGIKQLVAYLNKCDMLYDSDTLFDLCELELREAFSRYGFEGDRLPVVRGAALEAFNSPHAGAAAAAIYDLVSAIVGTCTGTGYTIRKYSTAPSVSFRMRVSSRLMDGGILSAVGHLIEGELPTAGATVRICRSGRTGTVVAATSMGDLVSRARSAIVLGSVSSLNQSIGLAIEGISASDVEVGDEIEG